MECFFEKNPGNRIKKHHHHFTFCDNKRCRHFNNLFVIGKKTGPLLLLYGGLETDTMNLSQSRRSIYCNRLEWKR